MRTLRSIAAVLLLMVTSLGSGCGADTPLEVDGLVMLPLGEPREGLPSREERLMWMLVNRARADPAAELADCTECADRGCYEPAPPVAWSHELARAARFHSAMLVAWRAGLTHSSPCALRADLADTFGESCDGSAACACEGGAFLCTSPTACRTCAGCTPFSARVSMFGSGPRAENIAMSGSAMGAMRMFLTEPYDVAECGYGTDSRGRPNGHRFNILTADRSALGAGQSGSYWTQDFGYAEAPRGLVAAVHDPDEGPVVDVRVGYHGESSPVSIRVNVGGTCTPMSIERGTSTNGTFHASVTVGTSCARYVVELEGGEGTARWPSTGSYGIACDDEWSEVSPPRCGCAPRCDGRACGDDGCGGSCGTCAEGAMCSAGACESPPDPTPMGDVGGADGGVTADASPMRADSGASDAAAPGAVTVPTRGRLRGTCCAHPGRTTPLMSLALLAAILVARRSHRPSREP